MKPITDLPSDSFLRLLLQGEPGSGKTTLACGLPGCVVIDIDGNLRGPVDYRRNHNLPVPLGYFRIDRDDDGKEIPPGERQFLRLNAALIECQKSPECQTIVLDSATWLASIIMDETKRKNPSVKDGRQHFNFFKTDCMTIMSTLTRMKKHIVLTAHERIEQDVMTSSTDKEGNPSGGIKQYRVVWPGQFGDYIGAFFTNVWRTEVVVSGFGANEVRSRVVRTQQDTQHPGLKNDYELPTVWKFDWTELENKLKGNK